MKYRSRVYPIYWSALASTVLLASSPAFAQPPNDGHFRHDGARHGPHGAEQYLAQLDEALDLSDDQAAELLVLLQSVEAERRSLHEGIASEYRPEFCTLMQETEAGILAVLTSEQADTFEQLKADRRARFSGRWGRDMPRLECDDSDS